MDNQNSVLANLIFRFTAPTPFLYKLGRNIWLMITAAAGVVITEAKAGIIVSEHLLLGAKVIGSIAALGIIHAQSKIDPSAINQPANTTATNDTKDSSTATT